MLQWLLSGLAIAGLLASLGRSPVAPWIAGLGLAALLSAAAGLAQYFGLSEALSPWVAPSSGVAYANLRQRNHLATLLVLGAWAWWWLVALRWSGSAPGAGLGSSTFQGRVRHLFQNEGWRRDAVLWLGWGLLALGAAATGSRTGLLQWVLLALCVAALPRPGDATAADEPSPPRAPPSTPPRAHSTKPFLRRAAQGLGLLLLYLLAAWALPWLADAAGAEGRGLALALSRLDDDEGCGSRLVLWSNVLHLIAQRQVWGWGWGELDYAHFITLYPGERFCAILDNAHNLPLHLAVTLGVPVALGFCFLLGVWVWRAQPWRETDPLQQLAWGLLAVIGIHSLLEYPLWYGPFQLVAVWCGGVLWRRGALLLPRASAAHGPRSLLGLRLRQVAALGFLALLAYVAFDYHRISQLYVQPAQRAKAYRTDTLAKAQASVLFRDQVDFAELTTSDLTPTNAAHIHALATRALHFSPEPKVVVLLLDSALLLGRQQEAAAVLARFDAAFPKEALVWRLQRGLQAPS